MGKLRKKFFKLCLVCLRKTSLFKLCEKHKIFYQIEAGGGCAENEQIQPSGKGVKTALLSIPVRNLHTIIETASIRDTECVVKLATAYIKGFKK